MSKKLVILLSIVLLIVGCSKKLERFYLDDELYEKSAITEITVNKLNELEKDKKNFMVFVFLPGCTSCAEFRKVLDEFIKENQIEFYSISILDVDDTTIADNVEYAPSLVLYKDGQIVKALDATSNDDKPALTSKEGLVTWLEKYIYLTK